MIATRIRKERLNEARRRGGFTLIELVMVIMILAIVAGLTVPVVGWLRRSANYGAQANTTASLASNLELFRTTYGNDAYPDQMDSLLLASDNTVEIPYVESGFGNLIVPGAITGDHLECFRWLNEVMDHTDTAHEGLQGNPGNTGTTVRPKPTDSSVAFPVALVDRASVEGVKLLSEIYPDGADADALPDVPPEVELVVFGIGPSNQAIGRTMANVPIDPRVDNSRVYGRYAAVFAVYSPRAGRRAQLKAVVNGLGRTSNNALSEFWQSTTPE